MKHEELEIFNNISYKGFLSQVIKVLKMLNLAVRRFMENIACTLMILRIYMLGIVYLMWMITASILQDHLQMH